MSAKLGTHARRLRKSPCIVRECLADTSQTQDTDADTQTQTQTHTDTDTDTDTDTHRRRHRYGHRHRRARAHTHTHTHTHRGAHVRSQYDQCAVLSEVHIRRHDGWFFANPSYLIEPIYHESDHLRQAIGPFHWKPTHRPAQYVSSDKL